MITVNKRRKANSILIFNFSTLDTKLPHKLLIEVNYLLYLCLMQKGENQLRLVAMVLLGKRYDIKGDQRCLNKQLIQDVVAYLLLSCYFIIAPKTFCQIIGFPFGSSPISLQSNLIFL